MRLIVGIGNPGREYEGTRHNCGFQVIDELAARHGSGAWQRDWNAQVAEWPASPVGKVLLIKPQTYVNRSGETVQAALAFHKLPVTDLLVVVDDLHLALGQLRLRPDGSAGGHNGLKDIQARIGTFYPRLRFGVGEPPTGTDQVGWVLGRFLPEDQATVQATVRRAADCCEQWLTEGTSVACRFNAPPPALSPTTIPERKNPAG